MRVIILPYRWSGGVGVATAYSRFFKFVKNIASVIVMEVHARSIDLLRVLVIPMRADTSRAGRQRERGIAMVEVGLTVVLLFGLMFLVMDLAMLLFLKSTMQQAVREGVRVGITGRLVGSTGYIEDSIRQTVQDEALGFLNGASGACKIQINYFNPDTGSAGTRNQGDVLAVSVNGFNYTPLGAILKSGDPFLISVSSSDVVERCPASGCLTATNPTPLTCP
jgi:Flp pilus assembly protein TadG